MTIQLAPDGSGTRTGRRRRDLAGTRRRSSHRGAMQDVSTSCSGSSSPASRHLGAAGRRRWGHGPELRAAARPEIVKDAVPEQVRDTGEPPSLAEEVDRSKSEAAAGAAAAQRRPSPAIGAEDDALDLGSAVLPVLIQRYAGYAVAAVVGIVPAGSSADGGPRVTQPHAGLCRTRDSVLAGWHRPMDGGARARWSPCRPTMALTGSRRNQPHRERAASASRSTRRAACRRSTHSRGS